MSEITEKDLKPCPFCGTAPHCSWMIREPKRINPDNYQIFCIQCGARGGTAWSEKEAAQKWNQRKENP